MGFFGRAVRWLFCSRPGILSIWAVLSFGLIGGALYWHFQRQAIFEASSDWWNLIAASALAWLPVLSLLLDSPDNFSRGPRPWLPLATLALLLALAVLAMLDHVLGWGYLRGPDAIAVRSAFFAFFLIALVPRVWNAINFARFDAEQRALKSKEANEASARQQAVGLGDVPQGQAESRVRRGEEAEAMGALLATLVVGLIGALAFFAGDGASVSLRSGFGFVLCFSVIGVFVVVVVIDGLSELNFVRDLGQSLEGLAKAARPLAAFYHWIDTALVRVGAAIVGMGHHGTPMRYLILIGTMSGFALVGWSLPPPLGLIPAFTGFVLAISVSRLWNWVEEDRSLASMTDYSALAPYRLDFREDYKDETLLAFAFVFLFAPIAMMQANDGGIFGVHLFENAEGRHLADWIGFFGIELAKAIPVVDWAEIYGVETGSEMISINGPASRHAVFLARVMVDLVLIAALLQVVSVWTRSRQQKQLYGAGHIHRLDPFVERVEFARAIRVASSDGILQLARLSAPSVVDFRTYDEKRLFAIYASTSDESWRAFIEAIARQRGIDLVHAIELAIDLAENNGDPIELVTTFNRAMADHRDGSKRIEADDVYRILTGVRARRGLRAFKEGAVDLLKTIATPSELIELLSGLAEGDKADSYQYAREYMAEAINWARQRL